MRRASWRRGRRNRTNSEQRSALLAEFHSSQLTQAEFAARSGLGLSTLHRWLRAEREHPPSSAPKPRLQEMSLARVLGGTRWAVEVVSPQGWTLRWSDRIAAEELGDLLRALPC